jgi:hypothetical protein
MLRFILLDAIILFLIRMQFNYILKVYVLNHLLTFSKMNYLVVFFIVNLKLLIFSDQKLYFYLNLTECQSSYYS